ncbi:hypothetical protein D3C81_1056840 [compost metagenome]
MQRLFHLALGGARAERLGQFGGELLRRNGDQFAALRAAHVVHRAGLGGALFLAGRLAEQRDQGEHQHVGRQRSDGRDVPAGVVEHVDHVEQRQVEAGQVADQRQQHGQDPHAGAGQQAADEAEAIGRRPVQHRQGAGEELQGGDEGYGTQVRKVLARPDQQVEAVAGGDDRGDQAAAGPPQPAVDVALGGRLVQRQHDMVEHHARQREGDNDHQAAGCGQAADEGGEGQPGVAHLHAQAEGEVLRAGGHAELEAAPQDRGYRQAHQQQEQRQAPAGADQRARVEVLGEGHVEHVRHGDGGREEHQQQGAPRAFLQRRMQGAEGGLVLQQPLFELGGPAEHAVQRVQADGGHRAQFDQ